MYLGIDIGSSSVKTVVIDEKNIYKAKSSYPVTTSPYEHDTAMVENAVAQAVRGVIKANGLDSAGLLGIGLCGHGPSIIFINGKGAPLTDILTWQDKRAITEAKLLKSEWPGFSKDATSYEAKLYWYYQNHEELFANGNKALYPKDYIVSRLCGEAIMDDSTASCVAYYDREAKAWDMGKLPIPKDIMPNVRPSSEAVGVTGTDFSRACGICDGIPVFPGGIDAFCEAVGAGGFGKETVIDGSGTSTCLSRSVAIDARYSLHVIPSLSLRIEMLSSTGSSYRWFGSLFPQVNMADTQLSIAPQKPTDVLFLPYLMGERSPIFDEKATGVFLGLHPDTSRADMLQAIFQGVAFACKQNIKGMGDDVTKVRAVGGSNISDTWLQIKANATGLVYQQMDELDASALGAALVAALGSGKYDLDSLERLIRVRKTFYPQNTYKDEYDALYDIYESLYGKLSESFKDLFLLRGRLA